MLSLSWGNQKAVTPDEINQRESLLDLNEQVWKFLKMLSKCPRGRRWEDLSSVHQEDLRFFHERIDFFLWKVSLHEGDHLEMIATAVTETRLVLFRLLHKAHDGWFSRRWRARWTLESLPPNVWLFRQVRQRLAELRIDLGPIMLPVQHDRLHAAKGFAIVHDPVQVRLAAEHCSFRSPKRRGSQAIEGNLIKTGNVSPETCCRRACDLLLIAALGFRIREACLLLGLKKTKYIDMTQECDENRNLLISGQADATRGAAIPANRAP